jgi:hypothetical protein
MWTERDVTLRLRRELGWERLVCKLEKNVRPGDLHLPGRFVICERRPTLTGRRHWPVLLLDDGTVYHGGRTTIREVSLLDEIIFVLETPDEQFMHLEPNILRRELELRDAHRRNLRKEHHDAIVKNRAARERRASDDARQRSKFYRRAFARVLDGYDPGVTA